MRNLALALASLLILGSCASRTQINQAGETTKTATPSLDTSTSNDLTDTQNNQSKPISFKKKFNVRIGGVINTSDKCKFGGVEYLVELKQNPKDAKALATTAVKPELVYKIETQLPEGDYVLILRNNRKAKTITTKKISIQEVKDSLTVDFNGCP